MGGPVGEQQGSGGTADTGGGGRSETNPLDGATGAPSKSTAVRAIAEGAWQYRVVRVAGTVWERMDDVELETILNAEGREGWELSGMAATERAPAPGGMSAFGREASIRLVFRRRTAAQHAGAPRA
jgi:hypothetical protein